jgi:phage baseplate assembly protein V
MGISQETLDQIRRHLFGSLDLKLKNLAGRATIKLVDDSGAMQRVQLGGIVGAPYDGAEHFQPWGISAVPLAGASCLVVFPSGDRGHPLVFAAADQGRPTGGDPGTVTVYNHTGASVTITKDGDIHAQAAPGRSVLVDDGGGAAAIPTMADFNALVSILNGAGTGAATAIPGAISAYQGAHPTWPVGTSVLKAK